MADQDDARIGGPGLLDDRDAVVGGAVVADDDLFFEADRLGVHRADLTQHLADGRLLLIRRNDDGEQHETRK